MKIPVLRLFACLVLLFANRALAESSINGRVTDSVSGKGLGHARLTFDEDPADGDFEAVLTTDPFGMYNAPLPAGDYEITASRGGYLSESATTTLDADQHLVSAFALVPALAGGGRDLTFQVACVFSGKLLSDVPVAVDIFASSGATLPLETKTAVTDTDGTARLLGCPTGFYRFRANDAADGVPRPKWLAFSTAATPHDKAELLGDHSVRIQLEPEKTTFTLQALGLNPAADDRFNAAEQPLPDMYVEITGVEFDAEGRRTVLVPARTGRTDENGMVTFRGLPHISWIVRTRKLGYGPFEMAINPDPGTGEFPDPIDPLRPALKSNKALLQLSSIYNSREFLRDLRVRVQGLENTNTEGIDFKNAVVFWQPGALTPFFWEYHTLYNLIPGRYRVSVFGQGGPHDGLAPQFTGEAYVEVENKLSQDPNLTWTDVALELKTVPGVVRGRLFAAENMGVIDNGQAEGTPVEPIYNPFSQPVEIEFVEYEHVAGGGPYLIPTERTVRVTTNDKGEFSVKLPSTRWGVRIPSLTTHWGARSRLRNLTTTVSHEKEVIQGWPFYS
jgi:hypothetical protein